MSRSKPFTIPTLAEADPVVYGRLLSKQQELRALQSSNSLEAREARRAYEAEAEPAVSAEVAELLGQAPSPKHELARKYDDLKKREGEIAAALKIVDAELRRTLDAASAKAISTVKPEWDRRTKTLADALKAVDAAHAELDDLFSSMEANDYRVNHLIRPFFLGNRREPDRKLVQYLREAGHA